MSAGGLPPPVGGWNARDSLAAMPPTDAVLLVNWIPDHGYLSSRGGSSVHASGLGGPVESLIEHDAGDGSSNLLAAANGKLFTAETGTEVEIGTGYANDRWQPVHHAGRTILCNGEDDTLSWDGSSLAAITVSNGPTDSPPGPPNGAVFIGCNSFKGRVFYWEDDAQSVWYCEAGAYQGTLQEYPLGRVIKKGGKLVMMVTYTVDAGDGVNDLAVFVMSTGETVVYQGDDPESVNAWTLVGNFYLGKPIGIRSHEQLGKNTVLLTQDAYVDIAAAIQNRRINEENSLSAKIIKATEQAARDYGSNFGWSVVFYANANLMIVNVPITEYNVPTGSAAESIQHVMNTNNGTWTKFEGWNAVSMTVYGGNLYYGDDSGNIILANAGFSDQGVQIELDALPAYGFDGDPATMTQVTGCRVITQFSQPNYIAVDGYADYEERSLQPTPVPPEQSAAEWDAEDWDSAYWGGDDARARLSVYKNCHRMGFATTVRIRMMSKEQRIIWYAWNKLTRTGGAR